MSAPVRAGHDRRANEDLQETALQARHEGEAEHEGLDRARIAGLVGHHHAPPASPNHVLALQRTVGNGAVAEMLRGRSTGNLALDDHVGEPLTDAVAGSPADQGAMAFGEDQARPAPRLSSVPVQREPPDPPTRSRSGAMSGETEAPHTDEEKWDAAATHFNIPFDSGHVVSKYLLEKGVWKKHFKNKSEREEILTRAHAVELNMYGGGKLGEVMRGIDTASRIMHLIGMIAGILGLVAGICGIWLPAALPVAAIAGIISMSAHGAMTVLQSILIAHNAIRLKAAKTPDERAKILPTLYRDITKLIFAVIGVAAGGVGTGIAAGHGIMSTAALGADQSMHIGSLIGENLVEGAASTGMMAGIHVSNMKESKLGQQGKFNEEIAQVSSHGHGGGSSHAPEPPSSGSPSPESSHDPQDDTAAIETLAKDASDARDDVATGKGATTEMSQALAKQQSEVGGLTAVTDQGPRLEQAVKAVDPESPSAKQAVDHDRDPKKEKAKISEAEQDLKEEEAEESSAGISLGSGPTSTNAPSPSTTTTSSTGRRRPSLVQTKRLQRKKLARGGAVSPMVQRANIFKRFASWVKSKFNGLFGRFSAVVGTMKAKMGAMALRLIGAKQFQTDISAGVAEQQARVDTTSEALTETEGAVEGYDESIGQLRSVAKSGGGRKSS